MDRAEGGIPNDGVKGSPERRAEILGAAFELLVERGYRGTSTLAIAQRARTSKETIYNWFGSKEGLFRELIGSRTGAAGFDAARVAGMPVEPALVGIGTTLLDLLLRDEVIAVNRAAIAEARTQPDLARILYERGRGDTFHPIAAYLAAKAADGTLRIPDPARAAEVFFSLLLGGVQWRRLLDIGPATDAAFVAQRARETAALFLRLYGAPSGPDGTDR